MVPTSTARWRRILRRITNPTCNGIASISSAGQSGLASTPLLWYGFFSLSTRWGRRTTSLILPCAFRKSRHLHRFPQPKENLGYPEIRAGQAALLGMLWPDRKIQRPINSPGPSATTRGGMGMLSNETIWKLCKMRLGVMAEDFFAQLGDTQF